MSSNLLLKKVMDAFPEAFQDLSPKKLRLVKEAVLYTSRILFTEELATDQDHKKELTALTGKMKTTPADRLRAYRLRAGLTQIQLAKKCGLLQSNIAAMESGKRAIGVITAKKLARALNCQYQQLI